MADGGKHISEVAEPLPEAGAGKPPLPPRSMPRAFLGAIVLWLLWVVGQIARDRSIATEFCFYIPSPFLLALLAGAGAIALRRGAVRLAWISIALAVPPLIFTVAVENRLFASDRSKDSTDALRLVHWNVFRGRLGWDRTVASLARSEADIYVLSEVPDKAEIGKLAARLGDDYVAVRMGGMAVLARGDIATWREIDSGPGVRVYEVKWRWGDRSLDLFAVDLRSSLSKPRNPRLQRLRAVIEKYRPDLVVGDFNAPRRSLALCPLPTPYRHAYEVAGRGWSYTWPVPLPVLAIDQCIVGERIRPLRYRLESTACSDHRRQVLDFELRAK